MWFLVSTLVTGLFGINIIYYIMQRNLIMNSFFMGNVRLEWALSVSSLILLCHTGRAKLINQILSCRYWMPIAKMGLSIYLIHPVLQYNIQSPREVITNLDFFYMFSNYICDVLSAIFAAFFIFILVEEPFTLLGKIITNKISNIDTAKNFIVLFENKINKIISNH
jgi:peptidoglycan/LPS O-acetylase OafA/YrhL